MTIFRSVGPVISVRLSWRSFGTGATDQSDSLIDFVSGKKSGNLPASNSFCRICRRSSSSFRVASNLRCKVARKDSASVVRIFSYASLWGALI